MEICKPWTGKQNNRHQSTQLVLYYFCLYMYYMYFRSCRLSTSSPVKQVGIAHVFKLKCMKISLKIEKQFLTDNCLIHCAMGTTFKLENLACIDFSISVIKGLQKCRQGHRFFLQTPDKEFVLKNLSKYPFIIWILSLNFPSGLPRWIDRFTYIFTAYRLMCICKALKLCSFTKHYIKGFFYSFDFFKVTNENCQQY